MDKRFPLITLVFAAGAGYEIDSSGDFGSGRFLPVFAAGIEFF